MLTLINYFVYLGIILSYISIYILLFSSGISNCLLHHLDHTGENLIKLQEAQHQSILVIHIYYVHNGSPTE